ncbi:hypothetical protein SteCoe_33732 [Stentor coeruleus]|uniref:non-specific serine/threonine protein kinase n=1 Tax=Stentor coeruleus TaxID=5963 RepID=A0A1R2AW38_9CILI|nr:hypothetical protein SteCoe_33732 [Stentor coeruleus]
MGCGKTKVKVSVVTSTETPRLKIHRTLIRKHTKNFNEEYQSGNKIGTGGFAEVRRCTHKLTGMMRAVKIYYKNQFPADYIASGGLGQEIEILRMIDHPNIVKVYEYFEDEKCFYITMEFCMGGELFDKISTKEKLSESTVCDIMRQLLSVIAYLHEKNIAHRDLKPENILLEDRNEELSLKLADFGNAVIFTKGKLLKGETGTSYYMAPEVVDSEYSEKCDEWSSGVILYMLLSGNPPFTGNNDEEIISNVKKQEFSLEGQEFAKVSDEAKDLIKKLLQPESTRFTAIEALSHLWFLSNPIRKNVRQATLSSVSHNLKNYKSSTALKEAIRAFIISQIITTKDMRPFREVFSVIDEDQDGKINEKDLVAYFAKNMNPNEAETEAQNVFKHMDSETKCLEYSEYLRLTLDSSMIMSRNNLVIAFNMLDVDKTGSVSAEKLMLAIGNSSQDINIWKAVIEEAVRRKDGSIELPQFIELLLHKI